MKDKKFSENVIGNYQDMEYPDDCIVDFDMKLIDLFSKMDKK